MDKFRDTTYTYKKAFAGLLSEYISRIHAYIKKLKNNPDDNLCQEVVSSFKDSFKVSQAYNFLSTNEKANYLINLLNRPIRVCGMVPADEDTGGGPFWVENQNGITDLQILESAQIDKSNPEIANIVSKTTHFNPVDIVCYTKDYEGKNFDLMNYKDTEAGFITKKSKDGKDLKAQELPGLWNGSMANWLSIFVEVPPITFNPVKSVTDLLEEVHR